MDKMAIYNKLPVFGQNFACFIEGNRIVNNRYSNIFWEALNHYEGHNNWSYDQMCEYRDNQLKKMMQYCYENVPYYRALFTEYGLNPESDINRYEDLTKLPILTRGDVVNNYDSLLADNLDRKKVKIHSTGGTTGAGLKFLTDYKEESLQWAIWWRYRRNIGIDFGTKCAIFGGKNIVPVQQKKSPFWRYNYPGNQIFYSGYHICKENAIDYIEHLRKSKIKWIHGYPSHIANLAGYIVELGEFLPMKWVTTGSENLHDYHMRLIKEAFGVIPYQHYGLSEGVANFSESAERKIIVDEDFACVEFVEQEEGYSKVIGTTLTNRCMPLVRYDTGDIVQLSDIVTNGRIINKINGREDEYIILPDGRKIGSGIIDLIYSSFHAIRESQIIQEEKNNITFNIVLRENASFDQSAFCKEIKGRIGQEMKFKIVLVDSIKKTDAGKTRQVIRKF